MTSSVFFKFKSQKEPARIEFDGTGISVFEVKREIISLSGLGDGKNFDLKIYNEDGMEEYDDDTNVIPRSTSIVARRLPAAQPGKGKAARYVSGTMPANVKNASRREQMRPKAKQAAAPASTAITENMTEEERMEAMLRATGDSWSAQKELLASQSTGRGGLRKGPQTNVPDHPPPPGYICYRCQERGHWIQLCPTNDDPDFEKKPRVKRTTGIPKSFLKTIEKPAALGANDGTVDDTKAPSGIMINAEGQYVIAEPDKKSWERFQAKTKTSVAAQKAAAVGDKELQERGLECSIDKKVFIDPMKTPCCGKTYCNNCITDALIESDFTCPACQTEGVLIDDLTPDEETSKNIAGYLEEKNNSKKESTPSTPKSPIGGKIASPSPSSADAANATSRASTPPVGSPRHRKSSTPTENEIAPPNIGAGSTAASTTTLISGKKRSADEVLNSPKPTKGPKIDASTAPTIVNSQPPAGNAQSQQTQQEQMLNNMMNMNMPMVNNFSGMPSFDMNMMGMGMGMNGMSMGMGMGMGMGMMNNFGMAGMNGMNGMNGMSMGMNPMMGGFGSMPGMMGMNGMGGMNGGAGSMGYGTNGNLNGNSQGVFPNQQKSIFAAPLPNEEESAYMRKPVNPHRHQGRQRRVRPSDYREL